MIFKDRTAAGQLLATQLLSYADRPEVRILALPRGGVPVAAEVAAALHAPLDVLVVRKLGVPGHKELAMGAIAPGGIQVLNPDIVRHHKLFEAAIHLATIRERRELRRREQLYRGDRPPLDVTGCVVIVIDDGLATGATMRAAVMALQTMRPDRIVIAVPVAAPGTAETFAELADEVVTVQTPDPFHSVGLWYEEFPQTSDDEVCQLLKQAGDGKRAIALDR